MNNSQIREGIFEALFGQAVIDNFYEELNSLPSDEELAKQYPFSQAHEMRMKKLFAKNDRRDMLQNAAKWSRRLAAAIAIVVTLLFVSLMTVPQVRAVVVQTLTEWYEKFVRFTSNVPASEKKNLEPKYIPDGFVEIVREETHMLVTIIYMDFNEDQIITFLSASAASASTSVDNEDKDYTILEISGIDYHLFTSLDSSGENSIVWEMSGQRYSIMSTISVEALTKMAISVREHGLIS